MKIKYLAQSGKTLSSDGYNGAGMWSLKKAASLVISKVIDGFDPAIIPDASGKWMILMIPSILLEQVESRSSINSKMNIDEEKATKTLNEIVHKLRAKGSPLNVTDIWYKMNDAGIFKSGKENFEKGQEWIRMTLKKSGKAPTIGGFKHICAKLQELGEVKVKKDIEKIIRNK